MDTAELEKNISLYTSLHHVLPTAECLIVLPKLNLRWQFHAISRQGQVLI